MLPRQQDIELPLLKVISDLGGQAKPPDVYPRLKGLFPSVTESDLSITLPSGVNKWKNQIAWVRQKLILQGELQSLARGIWAITDRGRQRLASPAAYRHSTGTQRDSQPTSTLSFIENLLPATSKSVSQDARAREKQTGDPAKDFENSVWSLVFALSPSAITVGRDPTIRLQGGNFRPDLVALFEENRVLLGECKFTTSAAFLTKWLSDFRSIHRELEEALRKRGYSQLVFVLFVRNRSEVEANIAEEAKNLRVRLVDEREVRYFHTLRTQSGIGIGHLFWSKVAPSLIRNREIRLPALRIKGPGRQSTFILSMNAHDLLDRCFVSHRQLHSTEDGLIGFQRMLQKKKLNEIVEYVRERQTFPTPIIVAFSRSRPATFEPLPIVQKAPVEMRDAIEFGHLRLPKDANSIQIIDGQHRLFGYSRVPRSDKHIVHVLAYKDDGQGLATMFVDINSKQTKVPSSLLWELYPDIYGEDDPQYAMAEISEAVESAARIEMQEYVEHISSGMHGPISFQALCSEVKRARLLEELREKSTVQAVLEAFFCALKDLGAEHKGVNESFIFTNNGIAPMIRTAGRVLQYEMAHGRRENLKRKAHLQDMFKRYFTPVYKHFGQFDQSKLRDLRKRTGNSGFNHTEDEITEAIRATYLHDFPYRPKKVPPLWENAITQFATRTKTINEKALDSGRSPAGVFRDFDIDRFKKRLLKPIDSEDSFGSVLTQLFKDILEGSGKDGPDGRIKLILGLPTSYDNTAVGDLNLLRTVWEHKQSQVDAAKLRKAMAALGVLCGKPNLGGFSELDKTDWQRAAEGLVEKMTRELLDPMLAALG